MVSQLLWKLILIHCPVYRGLTWKPGAPINVQQEGTSQDFSIHLICLIETGHPFSWLASRREAVHVQPLGRQPDNVEPQKHHQTIPGHLPSWWDENPLTVLLRSHLVKAYSMTQAYILLSFLCPMMMWFVCWPVLALYSDLIRPLRMNSPLCPLWPVIFRKVTKQEKSIQRECQGLSKRPSDNNYACVKLLSDIYYYTGWERKEGKKEDRGHREEIDLTKNNMINEPILAGECIITAPDPA